MLFSNFANQNLVTNHCREAGNEFPSRYFSWILKAKGMLEILKIVEGRKYYR